MPHAIPAPKTINRIVAAWDSQHCHACVAYWMETVATVRPTRVIGGEGKTGRGPPERANGTAANPVVSPRARTNRLSRAPVSIVDLPTAITASPELRRARHRQLHCPARWGTH